MSATSIPRQLDQLLEGMRAAGPCAVCGGWTAAEHIGTIALEVRSPASRFALGLADGDGATLIVALCRQCFYVGEHWPEVLVRLLVGRARPGGATWN